ncbi:hypothetical protein Tco_1309162, partial [Tanacetum coccineum]
FFEELLTDDSLSLPEHESFHFESDYDPSSPRPPAKPPNDDEIEPDMGLLTAKVVGDIFEHVTCDNRGLSRLDNQSIERDRLIRIGFVLDFVEFISFTFGDKEMILVIEAVSR